MLDVLWWILEPALFMGIMLVVFSRIMTSRIPDYPAYLMVGLAFWLWFSKSVMSMSNSILMSKELILQRKMPSFVYVWEVAFRDLFKQVFVVLLLFVIIYYYQARLSFNVYDFCILLALQFLVQLSLGCVCAYIVPVVFDFQQIISAALRLGFFASGVFYNIEAAISDKFQFLLVYNPMFLILKEYRKVFLLGEHPSYIVVALWFLFSISFLGIFTVFSTKMQSRYNKYITV